MREDKKLTEYEAFQVLYSLKRPLGYLLNTKLVHRNINPKTILLEFPDIKFKL